MLANAAAIREDAAVDFEAAGLLDGLEGKERDARRRLLERLARDGASLEELEQAAREDRLVLFAVERVLGGRYTARDLEERTGVPSALMLRIRHLTGLPGAHVDDPVFADEDLAAAESIKLFLDTGFGEEALAQITMVLGEAMARIAATTTATFAETFLKPGESEDEVAAAVRDPDRAAHAGAHPGAGGRVQGPSAARACAVGSSAGPSASRAGSRARRPSGCVLPIWSASPGSATEVEADELGTVVGQLAELAAEVQTDPVRLVKTIGDAAMFVSPELPQLVDTALSLVEAAERADLPAIRAGIASGPAVIRAGDYYGNSVNVASRVTGVARPGSVLCTEAVRDAASEEFEWSFAGNHRLKGLGEPQPLFRARRLGSVAEQASAKPSHVDRGGERSRKPRADRRRKRGSR